MSTPRLEIYPQRIAENALSVINLCHQHGIQVACVTKVLCAHPAILPALVDSGADMLADSRLPNLQRIADVYPTVPRLLLRPPALSQLDDTVRWANISLNSSLQTLQGLSKAAAKLGVKHGVILMVDVGDLREGVLPERIVALVTAAAKLPNLELLGLGANLACYGGVIPSVANMRILIEAREQCRKATGLPLDILSGGNSANLPLLASGQMPPEINHLRLGESIILGRNVLDRSTWQGTRQDTLRVVAEVVELESKPSVPIGARGQDAFGETGEYIDRGIRQRAILNLGRQDVVVDGLTPEDDGMIVLGGSSDHLIVDVSDAHCQIHLGEEIAFYPTYGALLAASTSSFVEKVVIND